MIHYRTRTAFGQSENIGIYALAATVNDLSAEAAGAEQVSAQIFLPAYGQKEHLYAIEKRIRKCCKEQGIRLSELYADRCAGVSQYMVSVTGVSLRPKEQEWYRETMRAGQDIVLAGQAGIEGTIRIIEERGKELEKRFAPVFLGEIERHRHTVFASEAIDAARAHGASAIRQAGVGGIFAALWRLSKEAGTGLDTDLKRMPILQETVEICEYFRLNPYQLTSAGTLLIIADHGETIADALLRKGIRAAVIGRLTDNNDKIIRNGEDRRFIDRPAPDEYNKIFMEDRIYE